LKKARWRRPSARSDATSDSKSCRWSTTYCERVRRKCV
jgi:hypothetical protein